MTQLVSIIVPPLGDSITEAVIAKWHKKKGEFVKQDELIVELETDKVTLEVNAPSSGVVAEIVHDAGASVGVGQLLGKLDSAASSIQQNQLSSSKESAPQQRTVPTQPPAQSLPQHSSSVGLSANAALLPSQRKRFLNNEPVEYANIGTCAIKDPDHEHCSTPAAEVNTSRKKTVKMTKLRQTIAKRLKEAQNTAAILTTFQEVDMTKLIELRKKYQEQFQKRHNVKLGFMSFFVRASVEALKEIPELNAEVVGDDIIYNQDYNIGVAVGGPKGLVVPVLKKVNDMSLAEIEKQILNFGMKAKDGAISMSDMSNGTFTITNGGIYGSMLSTPIINPPQTGILGMHNIVERPVVKDGQIVVASIMYIALSYDHRIIDGKEAVAFLKRIKELIENPERFLLAV